MSMASRMLRHARARAQLTQRELAAKVGIPQETIARIESGAGIFGITRGAHLRPQNSDFAAAVAAPSSGPG